MSHNPASESSTHDDDALLASLGYKPSLTREFTSLSTISFAFSIQGLCSSIATTLNTPLASGGPAATTWCWALGSLMSLTLAASVAELISAYPTCGGIYTVSAHLVPRAHRPLVGWLVGSLSVLAQFVGFSSTEYGLAGMVLAAVVVAKDGEFEVTSGRAVGLCTALLVVHGALNSFSTRYLARLTSSFVFINIGTTLVIIVVLLAMTPRAEMHTAGYVFGSEGIINGTQGWNTGVGFLLGLLSVQWTMTGYDCTAHISEEIKRASYLAPAAIVIAVIGTGTLGWLLNIVLVLCSGPLENLPGPSNSAFLEILVLRLGKPLALTLWTFVCLTAFCVCTAGMQAGSRTLYAFARDTGLQSVAKVSNRTRTPLRAVWATVGGAALPGLLALASPVAVGAVYAMTAMAFDLSYILPIFLRRVYGNHPEVRFVRGPFWMGDGWFGWGVNSVCIVWTLFVCAVFSLPEELPVTGATMNYAAPITAGVVILSLVWYFLGGRKYYHGPASELPDPSPSIPFEDVKEIDIDTKEA